MTTPPTDRQILELESRVYRRAGSKVQAISDELGISATVYAARLLAVLDAPDPALAVEFPGLIARRRRQLAKGLHARRTRRVA